MLDTILTVLSALFSFLKYLIIPIVIALLVFVVLCFIWYLILKYRDGLEMSKSNKVPQKKIPMFKQLFVLLPRRYMLDQFERDPDFFDPCGIHMFCGEQGSGKTMACTEMIMRLQKTYPKAKVITNYDYKVQDDELEDWKKLLDYTNGKLGVICGIDEIQNWFMSGKNQTLPDGVLELVTQNRKNRRIIPCTAQVFTRVNKGIREQVTLVYQPHTFFRCFTVVVIRKPEFDSEGNVTALKYRGMYSFVHTDELRNAYDTYKVIHTLAKDGIREVPVVQESKVYVQAK